MAKKEAETKEFKPKPQRRQTNQLTAAFVNNVEEAGFYSDGNCLWLRVDESGAKRWIVRTYIKGKRCDLGLPRAEEAGSVNFTKLADARLAANTIVRAARRGKDPLAESREKKAEEERVKAEAALVAAKEKGKRTLKEIATEAHSQLAPGFKNYNHAKQWLSSLEMHIFPKLGDRAIDTITKMDCRDVLQPIWQELPETSRRLKQRLSHIFEYAKQLDHCTENPITGILTVMPEHQDKKQHWPSLPYAEVPEFIRDLQGYEGRAARLAFEQLILTALRSGETLLAERSEVDLEAKIWRVPAIRMKIKDQGDHLIPLSSRSVEIFREAFELSDGGKYIFCGPTMHRPYSEACFQTAKKGLSRKYYDPLSLGKDGKPREIVPHGFRASFRNWCEERTSGYKTTTIEAALAHRLSASAVETAYLRTKMLEERTALMEEWAKFCTTPLAQVVPIKA